MNLRELKRRAVQRSREDAVPVGSLSSDGVIEAISDKADRLEELLYSRVGDGSNG